MTESDIAALRRELLGLTEALSPVTEFIHGYREQLLADDWSPTASEAMAIHLHEAVMRNAFSASSKEPA